MTEETANREPTLDEELQKMREEQEAEERFADQLMDSLCSTAPAITPPPAMTTKKKTRRLKDETFDTLKVLEQAVTPFEPHLHMHTKKFLQLERHDRKIATHAGGIESRVTVTGFYTERYTKDVYDFVESRKETLGVRPSDDSPKVMKEKVKEFHEMCFRGETAPLQVIMGEYWVARHFHDGRPKGTYCFKCRLSCEIVYLAHPWQMNSKKVERMMWFSISDVEFQSGDIVDNV